MDKQAKINLLKNYFNKRDDAVFAFLFGSQAEEKARDESDWDIAIYLKPQSNDLEFENTNLDYPQESQIWGDLTEILGTDRVDLTILNTAPASIAASALQGTLLTIKDRRLWLKFMLVITNLAEDYRIWAHDYHQIVQRSRSLSPQDRERLERLIDFTEQQSGLYPVYRQFSWNDYNEDPRKRNEIERWLENLVNATIDMAKVIVGSKKYLVPPTYRETVRDALRILELPEEFETRFEKWVQLRNVLAHEYLDIKWKRLEDFAKTSEPYITNFVSAVKTFLEKSRPE